MAKYSINDLVSANRRRNEGMILHNSHGVSTGFRVIRLNVVDIEDECFFRALNAHFHWIDSTEWHFQSDHQLNGPDRRVYRYRNESDTFVVMKVPGNV